MIDHYYHHLAQTSIRTMRIVIIYLSVNVIIMIDHHKHHPQHTPSTRHKGKTERSTNQPNPSTHTTLTGDITKEANRPKPI